MATPITVHQITNLTSLQVALRAVYFDQLSAVNEPGSDLMQLFSVANSTRATENSQGVGGFGDVPVYTGALQYDDFGLLYRKTYTHVEYAKGVAITRAALADDGYGVLAQRTRLMGIAFNRTIYKSAASLLNNATSTVAPYVGGDGKALIADDHPSGGTAGVQDNKGTTALSVDALIAAEIAMMQFTDSNGNPLNVMPDTLVVPVALKHLAETIVGSDNKSGTANNDKNTLSGYRVVVSRYLTDANNWYLVDSQLGRQYVNWFWREMPEFTEDPSSDYNLVLKYRGYMRFSYGFDSWQWIYGSIVA